jgi:hypothetical protein
MLYELRTYHVTPGKLPEVHDRFERHTLGFFSKHGVRPLGFWTSVIGQSANTLTYLLAWESLAERESVWNSFATDPEWLEVKADTERSGALVERAENTILAPTAYSRLS